VVVIVFVIVLVCGGMLRCEDQITGQLSGTDQSDNELYLVVTHHTMYHMMFSGERASGDYLGSSSGQVISCHFIQFHFYTTA
jgi:hypothetical protein